MRKREYIRKFLAYRCTKIFAGYYQIYKIFFCVFLFSIYFSMPALPTSAEERILAAERVEDGQPIDIQSKNYRLFFQELIDKHGFSQPELDQLFKGVAIKRSVLELMDRQGEAKPYFQYWPLFITPSVIAAGKTKLEEYKDVLDRIESELGVDREFVIAIWAIESRFGQHSGQYDVFQTLNTLFAAYPRRSEFFRQELLQFLLLCREIHIDPLSVKGSYAGAFGQTQFIPSSFREYAVSFDGDNRPDVFNSVEDVLASIANYLRHFHWVLDAPIYADIGRELRSQELIAAHKEGLNGRGNWRDIARIQEVALPRPPGESGLSIVGLEIDPLQGGGFRYIAGYPNFQAITAWNHSNRYAMAVTQLAEALMQ